MIIKKLISVPKFHFHADIYASSEFVSLSIALNDDIEYSSYTWLLFIKSLMLHYDELWFWNSTKFCERKSLLTQPVPAIFLHCHANWLYGYSTRFYGDQLSSTDPPFNLYVSRSLWGNNIFINGVEINLLFIVDNILDYVTVRLNHLKYI